ncbi:hypothetical protein [Wenzhouxiangella sp. XN24]|uniref:hypothetical protein n=1 Tax=Wenzhouxiangella sp. XN24 TaxID=2713569 RepID=UPI0013EA11AC|nr:hypothetical protein [Wenzhouxiangella sp. XN24]NGX16284.1 hypothetical protein [Wenzhouxiangella sp. XN24]
MYDPRAYYQGVPPGYVPPQSRASGYYPPGTFYAAPPPPPMSAPGPLANPRFFKGALVGALAAYLLSHPEVQEAAVKGAVKAWSVLQGGVEEMKERFRDAEAELHAASAGDAD